MGGSVQFLDPTNPNPGRKRAANVLRNLRGARVAFLNNGWMSMTRIGRRIEGPLKARYGAAEVVFYDVPRNAEPPGGLLERVAEGFDAAIVGMAN